MSSNAPLLERLRDEMDGLRNSERKVAEVVVLDPAFAVNATMAGVAAAAGVSEPTVMRFCNRLGFAGFQQFRISLAQTLAVGLPATLSAIGPTDSIDELTTKIFDHTMSSLDRARRYLDSSQVEKAVEAILASESVDLAGLGASGVIALDVQQKAALFGIPCTAPPDPHQQYMAAAMAGPKTVTIVISNTGRTDPLVHVARTARGNGATVIAMTGSEDAPLLEHCDIPIVVRTIEDTDVHTPTVSRLAGLVVVDILATAVALRRGPAHLERLSAMKDGLTRFRRND